MGTEVEYGIHLPDEPGASPQLWSSRVVTALPGEVVPWDYGGEQPLADARGFELSRQLAHPDLLTDDLAVAIGRGSSPGEQLVGNRVLPNGGRLYVDHAHPEYSAPETVGPLAALAHDRAGERIMATAVAALRRERGVDLRLYKNNTDGKGASYGTHENHLVDRAVPWQHVVRALTPLMVVRPLVCGAGRVGLGRRTERAGYQMSARADFVERVTGLETTMRRPLVNARDEPHADPARWRRLHLITGDATHADVSTVLQLGLTALRLAMLEAGALDLGLALVDPVGTTARVSHDVELLAPVHLEDGRSMTALDLHELMAEEATAWVRACGGPADAETALVLRLWAEVLTSLRGDRAGAARRVEWLAKHAVVDGLRVRGGLDWDDPRLLALDLQWAEIGTGRGLAQKAREAGRLEALVDEATVADAVTSPPADTRAHLRGRLAAAGLQVLLRAGWDRVVLATAEGPCEISTPEPLDWSREQTTAALAGRAVGAEPLAEPVLTALAYAGEPAHHAPDGPRPGQHPEEKP